MTSGKRAQRRTKRSRGGSGASPLAFSELDGSQGAGGASGFGTTYHGVAGGDTIPGQEHAMQRMGGGHGGGACATAVPLGMPISVGGRRRRNRGGNFLAQVAVPAALLVANNTVGRYGVRGTFGMGRRSRFLGTSSRRSRRAGRRSRRSRRYMR